MKYSLGISNFLEALCSDFYSFFSLYLFALITQENMIEIILTASVSKVIKQRGLEVGGRLVTCFVNNLSVRTWSKFRMDY